MTHKSSAAWRILAAADQSRWDACNRAIREATPQQIMDAYIKYRAEHPEFRRLYRLHVEQREREEAEARAIARQIVGILEVAGR